MALWETLLSQACPTGRVEQTTFETATCHYPLGTTQETARLRSRRWRATHLARRCPTDCCIQHYHTPLHTHLSCTSLGCRPSPARVPRQDRETPGPWTCETPETWWCATCPRNHTGTVVLTYYLPWDTETCQVLATLGTTYMHPPVPPLNLLPFGGGDRPLVGAQAWRRWSCLPTEPPGRPLPGRRRLWAAWSYLIPIPGRLLGGALTSLVLGYLWAGNSLSKEVPGLEPSRLEAQAWSQEHASAWDHAGGCRQEPRCSWSRWLLPHPLPCPACPDPGGQVPGEPGSLGWVLPCRRCLGPCPQGLWAACCGDTLHTLLFGPAVGCWWGVLPWICGTTGSG